MVKKNRLNHFDHSVEPDLPGSVGNGSVGNGSVGDDSVQSVHLDHSGDPGPGLSLEEPEKSNSEVHLNISNNSQEILDTTMIANNSSDSDDNYKSLDNSPMKDHDYLKTDQKGRVIVKPLRFRE